MCSLGQVAYEAYCEATDGKSLVSGAELPKWYNLPDDICHAWEIAAGAVADDIKDWIDERYSG